VHERTETRASVDDASDGHLVALCRVGDPEAWRALVDRYAGLVNAILRGGFRFGAHDAEDAFQEVFTRLYLKLSTVREHEAVSGWIAQVTRNVAVDWLRRNGREVASSDEIDEAAFEEPLQAVEEALVVRAAMGRLATHQQEILDRFFARDESYRTIGDALGIPPGTVASRISRALARLREELEPGGRSPVAAASSS
jgi:RNA polymerase sigma factor (sigma-70 family)